MRELSQADPAQRTQRFCDRSMASRDLPGPVFSMTGVRPDLPSVPAEETAEVVPSLASRS